MGPAEMSAGDGGEQEAEESVWNLSLEIQGEGWILETGGVGSWAEWSGQEWRRRPGGTAGGVSTSARVTSKQEQPSGA